MAIEAGRHVVMVNVEADVLCGPALARRATERGVVSSLAYGDQPALIAEPVDWARARGLPVVAAGKGTRYLPSFHRSTPATMWEHYGLSAEQAATGGMNPKMFNSFLDGTKSAIEMAAVANACGLAVPRDGLAFPRCGVDDLPLVPRPRDQGGQLEAAGVVEVVSSLERDGRAVPPDLRWGAYIVFSAPTDYVARCFSEYGLVTSPCGRYAALYRPYHLIGLELGVSVAPACLRQEATGAPRGGGGHDAATAKRAFAERLLPIGLAQRARLRRAIRQDALLTEADVELDQGHAAMALRAELRPAA
jgi:predicted homoserine dehydrogenase-like protein